MFFINDLIFDFRCKCVARVRFPWLPWVQAIFQVWRIEWKWNSKLMQKFEKVTCLVHRRRKLVTCSFNIFSERGLPSPSSAKIPRKKEKKERRIKRRKDNQEKRQNRPISAVNKRTKTDEFRGNPQHQVLLPRPLYKASAATLLFWTVVHSFLCSCWEGEGLGRGKENKEQKIRHWILDFTLSISWFSILQSLHLSCRSLYFTFVTSSN